MMAPQIIQNHRLQNRPSTYQGGLLPTQVAEQFAHGIAQNFSMGKMKP
jgi:hypothetical protein